MSKQLSPEWRRYMRSIREIQRIIDEGRKPWYKKLAVTLRKRIG